MAEQRAETEYRRVAWLRFGGTWAIVAGLVQAFVGYGWYYYGWTVFVRLFMKELGWSAAMVGGFSSFARITGIWAPILAGFHVDSMARFCGPAWGTAIWLGLGFTVGWAWLARMTAYWQGFIIYGILIYGAGVGGLYRMNYTAANRWWMDRRAFAIAAITLGGGFGGVVMLPYIAVACETWGWRTAAWIASLTNLIFCVVVAPLYPKFMPERYGLYMDNVPPEERRRRAEERAARRGTRVVMRPPLQDITVGQALRSFTFWCLVTSGAVIAIGAAPLSIFQNARMGALGYSTVEAAQFYSLTNMMTYVGRFTVMFFGDWLTARFPPRFLMASIYVLLALGLLIFGLGTATWHFYAWAVIYGIGFGLSVPYYAVLMGAYFGRGAFGTIYGLRVGIPAPFGIVAPTLAGWLADVYGWVWPFVLAAAAYTVGLIILCFAVPPKEQLRERVRE